MLDDGLYQYEKRNINWIYILHSIENAHLNVCQVCTCLHICEHVHVSGCVWLFYVCLNEDVFDRHGMGGT